LIMAISDEKVMVPVTGELTLKNQLPGIHKWITM